MLFLIIKKKTIILIILINIDREDFSSSSKGPLYIYITTLLASLFHSFLSSPLLASIFLLQWKIHRDKTFYSTGCGSTRGKKSSKTCGGSNKSAGNPDRSAAAKKACVFMQRRGNIEFFPSQWKAVTAWRRHDVPSFLARARERRASSRYTGLATACP